MSTVDEVIHDALYHYADHFYDPQKAHDYYIRTRQLHPRQASIRGPQQTEALQYATHQIQEQKKAALAALKKQHAEQIKRILASVQAYVNAEAAKLNHPPAGLNEKQLRAWVANEKQQMSRARAEIHAKITAAIKTARVNYANAVKSVNSNYKTTLATERTKISEHVYAPPQHKGRKGHHGKKSKSQTGTYTVGQSSSSSKKQSGVYTVGS